MTAVRRRLSPLRARIGHADDPLRHVRLSQHADWLNGAVRERRPLTTCDTTRFDVPLYTVAEAARLVGVHPSTLASWARGYVRPGSGRRPRVTGGPAITHLPTHRAEPSIPFVGLAEALVLAAIRRSGVSLQRIRPALKELQERIGVDHALASQRLYTDGAELLFDFGESRRDTSEGRVALDLVVVRSGQRVFAEVIGDYLRRIEYGPDGYAALIHVPVYEHAAVVADPTRAFGAAIFERGGARVEDVMHRFWAGESLSELSDEFGVPVDEIEDVVRVASRPAA